ncbi:MAG: hypothetical protein II260_01105 [Muribaculaceae bacterium]|nr:hypothetical protein [Muribaculaceae bacterium]
MKEKCDNECATCPMQGQVYCSLAFAKASNQAIKTLEERMCMIEQALVALSAPKEFIEPIRDIVRDASYAQDELKSEANI